MYWVKDKRVTGHKNRISQSVRICAISLRPNSHRVIQRGLDIACTYYSLYYSRKKPKFSKPKLLYWSAWPVFCPDIIFTILDCNEACYLLQREVLS